MRSWRNAVAARRGRGAMRSRRNGGRGAMRSRRNAVAAQGGRGAVAAELGRSDSALHIRDHFINQSSTRESNPA
jgi:hypothetical protein